MNVTQMSLKRVIEAVTKSKGQIIEIEMIDADYESELDDLISMRCVRAIWTQSTEGWQLAGTKSGTRVYQILPNTAGSHTAVRRGDTVMQVNNLQTDRSDHIDVVEAISNNSDAIIHFLPDSSEVVGHVIPISYNSDMKQAMLARTITPTEDDKPSTGVRKLVTLQRAKQGGLGMTLATLVDTCGARIEQVIEGSPAHVSGKVKVGDRILQCNGLDLASSSHDEVCAAMTVDMHASVTLLLEEDSSELLTNRIENKHLLANVKERSPQRLAAGKMNKRKSGIGIFSQLFGLDKENHAALVDKSKVEPPKNLS